MRKNRNLCQPSQAQNLDLSTMSHYPLNNNNTTINYQNTAPYVDSTLDISMPETQYQYQDQNERDFESSPNQNMHSHAMKIGREIDILHQQRPRIDSFERHPLHQQRPRIDSFERHPFRQEIRKHSGDEMLMESMKRTSKRVTERIRRRKKSQNSRKVSEMSGDDEKKY